MRGSILHGARYNIRSYFGALYTSLKWETAQKEVARYYTVPPREGFVRATIAVRLTHVLNLTNRRLLRKAGVRIRDLTAPSYRVPQEFGRRAWENGIEALLVPAAADPDATNLAILLDNQHPRWRIELISLDTVPL